MLYKKQIIEHVTKELGAGKSIQAVADEAGVSRASMYQFVRRNKIPHARSSCPLKQYQIRLPDGTIFIGDARKCSEKLGCKVATIYQGACRTSRDHHIQPFHKEENKNETEHH